MTKQTRSDGMDRLQSRARDLLERAERMQDLHSQAQARVLAGRISAPAQGRAETDAIRLLAQSSNQAIAAMHLALQDAAQEAGQLAQGDPQIACLNNRIHGAHPERSGDLIDVDATEIVDSDLEHSHRLPAPLPAAGEPDPKT